MSTKQAVFQLNGEEYGLLITDVSTVEKDMDIRKMANSPSNVKGKINLRDRDIPVYSLRRKFGIEDIKQDKNTRYLIIDVKGMDIAFEVDHMKGILDLESSDIFDVPPVIKCNDTSYIKSIANVGDGLILLLDSNYLLEEEEIKALQPKSKE
ncbi:MAG: purine-binding chemotaxis protein CheW [Clostridiales bacterium]|jgi:purine-binding chemotaxis protein CheW|nr:purine-binding chemotaxis protein CheW [Clostridiales bacterium]